jgi:hypothetical protein
MPRRVGALRRLELPGEPFERPVAVWRELGAPADLYDLEVAADAYLDAYGPLIDPELGGGPRWFYARRWWRQHRPRFLEVAGQLTPAEAAMLAHRRQARERPEARVDVRRGRL